MKTLYLECNMGAAGDMLNAALYDICTEEQKQTYLAIMNRLNNRIEVEIEDVTNSSIVGKHMHVHVKMAEGTIGEEQVHDYDHGHEHGHIHEHDHIHEHGHIHEHDHHPEQSHEHTHDSGHQHGQHHEHHTLADIEKQIEGFAVSETVKKNVRNIYENLAQAESHAHGKCVDEIHFHEVGSLDAIADITGVCVLMELLEPQKVVVSAINLGSGNVWTSHGILPVPTPATAFLLQDIPSYMSEIESELCTPTGAAILRRFATEYGKMPVMELQRVGYGMGTKAFARLNCVRAMLGEEKQQVSGTNGKITRLSANIDDMTGEELGYCLEKFMCEGALDAYAIPIYMKKNRPAYEINVMCKPEDADILAQTILKHTSTFGVRRLDLDRYKMDTHFEQIQTIYGPVQKKNGIGYGIEKSKLEYEDLSRIAKAHALSLREVINTISSEK